LKGDDFMQALLFIALLFSIQALAFGFIIIVALIDAKKRGGLFSEKGAKIIVVTYVITAFITGFAYLVIDFPPFSSQCEVIEGVMCVCEVVERLKNLRKN